MGRDHGFTAQEQVRWRVHFDADRLGILHPFDRHDGALGMARRLGAAVLPSFTLPGQSERTVVGSEVHAPAATDDPAVEGGVRFMDLRSEPKTMDQFDGVGCQPLVAQVEADQVAVHPEAVRVHQPLQKCPPLALRRSQVGHGDVLVAQEIQRT